MRAKYLGAKGQRHVAWAVKYRAALRKTLSEWRGVETTLKSDLCLDCFQVLNRKTRAARRYRHTREGARARVCVCVCVCLHGIPHSFGDHENGEGLGVFGVREEWRLRPPVAVAERRSAGQRESSERWWQRPQPQQPQRQQQQQHRHRAPAATTSRPTERRGRSLRFGGGLFVEWLAAEAGLRWGRKGPAPAPAPAPARPLRALLTASSFSREMCRGADVSLPSLVSRL